MSKAVSGITAKIPIFINYAIQEGKPRFATFMKYAKVELAPPTPGDIPKAMSGIRSILSGWRTGRYKQLTVREAWLNSLVFAEVSFWFFVGECIGKRHLRGYEV